jgi:glycosyltransferase involved in cell wall biosynthesis
LAYFKADAAIRLSELNPPDGESLRAKREYIIPYGIEDRYSIYKGKKQNQDAACNILFVGALRESKGVLVVLDVANRLRKQGLNFRLNFVGRFKSGQFRQLVFEKVTSYRLEEYVAFLGVLTGDKKWEIFATSDILCFPSFFESETFGLVVLEAMQFALPVVATRWRGIPSLVKDGESGFLVPVKDSRAVAEKLEFLIKNPIMVKQMGQNGRKIYLDEYCFEVYLNRLEQIFLEIGDSR